MAGAASYTRSYCLRTTPRESSAWTNSPVPASPTKSTAPPDSTQPVCAANCYRNVTRTDASEAPGNATAPVETTNTMRRSTRARKGGRVHCGDTEAQRLTRRRAARKRVFAVVLLFYDRGVSLHAQIASRALK